jgi:hypothetical protein
MAGSHTVYTGDTIDLAGLASPFGAMLALGQDKWHAGMVQALATLLMAVLVGVVWRRGLSLPVRAAVLLAATPVAIPIIMFYDLMLTGVAIAWLVCAGRTSGFAPRSKSALAAVFVLPLLSGNLQGAAHWLIAPTVAMLGVALAIAAAWRDRHAGQSDGVMMRGSLVADARSTMTPGAVPGALGVHT